MVRRVKIPGACVLPSFRTLRGRNIARAGLRSFHDFKLELAEFGQILPRYLIQNRIALARKMHFDESAVLFALNLAHQTTLLGALNEPHHGVVTRLQKFRQFGNRGPAAARITRHSQHQLVLLRGNSAGTRYTLTETQKAPYPVAKPAELPQSFSSQRGNCGRGNVTSHKNRLYHNVI